MVERKPTTSSCPQHDRSTTLHKCFLHNVDLYDQDFAYYVQSMIPSSTFIFVFTE